MATYDTPTSNRTAAGRRWGSRISLLLRNFDYLQSARSGNENIGRERRFTRIQAPVIVVGPSACHLSRQMPVILSPPKAEEGSPAMRQTKTPSPGSSAQIRLGETQR